MRILSRFVGLLCLLLLVVASTAAAQELEPRVYLASPVGTNIIVVGANTSRGDVVTDPTLPIEDVRARVGALALGYYRYFDLLGRSASLGGVVPVVRASVNGLVAGEPGRADRLGLGDAAMRLTVNLAGSPAADLATFVKRGRHANLGASLVMSMPTGEYDSTKVVNLGTNRWSFKPEIGLSLPVGEHLLVDTYFGVWLFGQNDDYLGQVREQDPLVTTQLHVSYNLTRRAWAAFDATFYAGGSATVAGQEPLERLNNTRVGATLSMPIASRQALKIAFSAGARVRLGSDFKTLSLGWSYVWGRGF